VDIVNHEFDPYPSPKMDMSIIFDAYMKIISQAFMIESYMLDAAPFASKLASADQPITYWELYNESSDAERNG